MSEAELIQRSKLPKSRRSAVYYHLNPNIPRKRGHQVPRDIIQALADVLLVPFERLAAPARVAAGFQEETTDRPDIPTMVARFLGDTDVPESDRQELADRLIEILGHHAQRRRRKA